MERVMLGVVVDSSIEIAKNVVAQEKDYSFPCIKCFNGNKWFVTDTVALSGLGRSACYLYNANFNEIGRRDMRLFSEF
jgi:hypothetical protein